MFAKLLTIAILLCAAAIFGAEPAGSVLFLQGQRLMREKDFFGAAEVFGALLREDSASASLDVYTLALGRAQYHSGDFRKAAEVLTPFASRFPGSPFLPFAHYVLGNCQYRSGRTRPAFGSYLSALTGATDEQLRSLAKRSLLAIVDNGFVPPDSFMRQTPEGIACEIRGRVAQAMKGRWTQTKLSKYLAGCEGRPGTLGRSGQSGAGVLTIGILLPLQGPYGKFGQAILDGAMLAVDGARAKGTPVELRIYDSQADHLLSARTASALVDEGADAIIGPLLSEVSATVAAALSCQGVPLLVPAATQASFTQLSATCFQLTPNLDIVARGLAQYAIRGRQMKRLIGFVPATVDELRMAEVFAAEVVRLGAPRPIIEKFRPDETDFGAYIKDLKQTLGGPRPDSAVYITPDGDTLDPGEEPMSVDGILAIATADQLNLLLPQLEFYKVRGTFLGGDEWDNDMIRRFDDKILHENIFYSSTAAAKYAPENAAFAAAFAAKYGSRPDRLAAVGYDAVDILVDAWAAGRRGSPEITEYLKTLSGYFGTAGRVSFGKNRSNLELPLFTIQRGTVVPLSQMAPIDEEGAPSDSSISVETKY